MEKLLKGLTVISLVGYQGSGKTTLGKELAGYLKTLHIETSTVVKETVKWAPTRDLLPSTGVFTLDDPDWMGVEIRKKLLKWLPSYKKKTAVLTGVREVEIHKYLRRQGARLYIFEITASPILRFNRVKDLGKVSDARKFVEHELKERELGIEKVLKQAKFVIRTDDILLLPKENAEAIANTLFKRGVKCR